MAWRGEDFVDRLSARGGSKGRQLLDAAGSLGHESRQLYQEDEHGLHWRAFRHVIRGVACWRSSLQLSLCCPPCFVSIHRSFFCLSERSMWILGCEHHVVFYMSPARCFTKPLADRLCSRYGRHWLKEEIGLGPSSCFLV